MTSTTFSLNQAGIVILLSIASLFIGSIGGSYARGLFSDAEHELHQRQLRQAEQTIADDLEAKRQSAERAMARMRDGDCSHLAIVEAQQQLDVGSEHEEEMRSTMQKGHVGLSYRWAMHATNAYARVSSAAQGCLQAGGAQ